MKTLRFVLGIITLCLTATDIAAQRQINFNENWRFQRIDEKTIDTTNILQLDYDDSAWDNVIIPHTAHIEPLVVNSQWQGICWYRKTFNIPRYSEYKKYFIQFEGAMNIIDVWVNGQQAIHDMGGYMTNIADITPFLKASENIITVRLDNTDNAVTGPKPLKKLDFNMYGGIYRNIYLIEKEMTYISNPLLTNIKGGGGILITYPEVSEKKSTINIKTHIINEDPLIEKVYIRHEILYLGKTVAETEEHLQFPKSQNQIIHNKDIILKNPNLWSPEHPFLYTVKTSIYEGNKLIDTQTNKIGIRDFRFINNELYINGEKTFLRGVNRHQEYPFVGYALSDNAQFRDAYRIKQAGFNYIRLSHYPQSTAFLNACDELGIVVIDAILGWQYFNDSHDFIGFCYDSARKLIRRDRNHPCVLAWEVSLNETKMPLYFKKQMNRIVHEEYPGEQGYSCGWEPEEYDIYLEARQHRLKHDTLLTYNKPYLVSEYGDWEYFSKNMGFNQHIMKDDQRNEKSSRQSRKDGEIRLLQQANNIREAHNDNLMTPAFGDGYWIMYDYNRGNKNNIENSGIMDIFRLPKFSYYFFKSQNSANLSENHMVKIASLWNNDNIKNVTIFSNADYVELYLNNKLIGSKHRSPSSPSERLSHPPFIFHIDKFIPGTLKAIGYKDDTIIATDEVKTPGCAIKLTCWSDAEIKSAEAKKNDLVFVYFQASDKHNTIDPNYNKVIHLEMDENLTLMNPDEIRAEAGIATALIRVGNRKGIFIIRAKSEDGLVGKYVLCVK